MRFICYFLISTYMWSFAQADFGIGAVIGQPSGISMKYSKQKDHAIDAALAWDLSNDDRDFYFHGDYLWLRNGGLSLDRTALDWYFGIGGRLVIINHDNTPAHRQDDDYKLGVRGPIGLGYTFQDPRIEVFGELALILNLLESTNADVDGGIGARFHF